MSDVGGSDRREDLSRGWDWLEVEKDEKGDDVFYRSRFVFFPVGWWYYNIFICHFILGSELFFPPTTTREYLLGCISFFPVAML